MSFARTFGKGFAWTTAGTVAGKIVMLANIFLILHQLTVYEYGLTELVFSVVSTVGLFLLPGLAATVTTDLGIERARGDRGRMKALFSEFFLANMVLGIIAWAVLFFGSTVVAQWSGNILIDSFFKIVSFSFLISPLRAVSSMLAVVSVRYADQILIGLVEEVAKGGWLVAFLLVFDRGAAGLLWAYVLAPAVAVLVFAPRTLSAYREFARAQPVDQQPFWNMLREHRKWNIASTYANTLGKNLQLWIIKLLLGTEAVGLYAFASGIYGHASGFANLQNVLTPLVPRYVERPSLLARILAASMKYQLLLSIAVAVGCAVIIPLLVYFAFPHYQSALTLTLVMLLALIPHGIVANLTPVFMGFKERHTQLLAVGLRTASTAVLLPMGIVAFGLLGAGVEFVLTMLILMFERTLRVRRFLPEFTLSRASIKTVDPVEREFIYSIADRFGVSDFVGSFVGGNRGDRL